ncbi:hypothetical protein N7448_004477 [Penicillium atrosanguineum]|uniref:SigF-like NTF2-like domain-containing protein n=1 Tax=Penicillium atrosanguineum TaxID=1132637 RepID=A0A9W9U1X0_9EURO|nr:aminotransferase [Penicillium atrosanguineum]KAJ5125150.1 hypothetical protein N7526_007327 [Penicillium atrosanguineum]KAJ5135923.1 hypothetical protein N7448_004477 [Penicillium atrosanguineum]KAJ5292277.1 aminotransferase [Penicillium atrosanguineum]KAJ5303704.1 hypothetical protein N7476_010503 [Penicillium atrosanguineum]
MENPVVEIPAVISLLTQSTPTLQQKTLERFFTNDASFVHPFCRVPSFEGSRWWILKIFQWYKIMSPRIKMEIHSIAMDEKNLKIYVHMSQIFSIWIVPFHVAPATLTTVLDLTTDSTKTSSPTNGAHPLYYITKQEDLYQTSEFVKFILPHVGHWLVFGWHLFATFFCFVGVTLLWPLLWMEENGYLPSRIAQGNLAYNIDRKVSEIKKH